MAVSLYTHPIGCSLSSTYTSTSRIIRIVIPPGSLSVDSGGAIRLTFGYRGTTYRRMFEKVYFGRAVDEDPYYEFDGSQVQVFFNDGDENINEYSGAAIITDPFIYPVNADDYHILSIETGATTNYIPNQYHADAYGHRFYAGYSSTNTAQDDGFDHYYASSDRYPALICAIEGLSFVEENTPVIRNYGFDLAGRSGDDEGVVQSNLPGVTLEAEVSYSNASGSVPLPTINATGWDADYLPNVQGYTPTLSLDAVCGMFSQEEWLVPLPKLEARSGHRMSLDKKVAVPTLSAKTTPIGRMDKKCPTLSIDAYGQAPILGVLEASVPMPTLSARIGSHISGLTPVARLSAKGYLDSKIATLSKAVPLPTLEASGAGRSMRLSKSVPVPTLSSSMSKTSFNATLDKRVPVPRISATMSRDAYNYLDEDLILPKISASGGLLEPGSLDGYVPIPYIQAVMSGEDHGFCDHVLRYTR